MYSDASENMSPTQEKAPDYEDVLDFNKPDYTFIPNGIHQWRQQGPYLVCYGCELQHAAYIGIDKRMVGVNENGKPIIENV